MTLKLDWKGPEVLEQIADRLLAGVSRWNEQLAADAKQQLYPGHGMVTGQLKNSIHAVSARRDGTRIIGTVGAYGCSYSLLVHERHYRYILDPLESRLGSGAAMIVGS